MASVKSMLHSSWILYFFCYMNILIKLFERKKKLRKPENKEDLEMQALQMLMCKNSREIKAVKRWKNKKEMNRQNNKKENLESFI